MADDHIELTKDQWQFLAVLEALGGSSSFELLGNLMPLKPGPLFELLRKGKINGLLLQKEDDQLILDKNLPAFVQKKIKGINNLESLSGLVRKIQSDGLEETMEPASLIQLLQKTGKVKEAAEIEFGLVRRAQGLNQNEKAKGHLEKIIRLLFDRSFSPEAGNLFTTAVLQYSDMCFLLGQDLDEIEGFLHRAHKVAKKAGDRRSHGLITLHFGRLFYFRDRRDEALVSLSAGCKEIKALGDDDILSQSSGFLGIYFFIQGLFQEALKYLEKAEQLYKNNEEYIPVSPLAPLFLGFCESYLGQFHRAVGTLDYNWQLAKKRSEHALATTMRAELGTVLVVMGNTKEALPHLENSRKEALAANNFLALYLNGGGFALYHFAAGRLEKAYDTLKLTYQHGRRVGLVRQYASPWILEMLYEFHRLGFKPIPQLAYPDLKEAISKGGNIHLQGVELRLNAMELLEKGQNQKQVLNLLFKSENFLAKSGDRIQQAKTMIEMARVYLGLGNRKRAGQSARQAWELLDGHAKKFFPDEFRMLLEKHQTLRNLETYQRSFLKPYFEMWEELFRIQEPEEMMPGVVRATNGMFGAERGGLFWFPNCNITNCPELQAACNLSSRQVKDPQFKPNLQIVLDSFRQKKPVIFPGNQADDQSSMRKVQSILCIPLEVQNKVQAIFYYDNSYLEDAFNFLDIPTLEQMARHNSIMIERLTHYLASKRQNQIMVSQKDLGTKVFETRMLIGDSNIMKKIKKQADKAAVSDSTILIMGASGTGKELLAQRIRQKSLRKDNPLVIVDVTTIPETLFHSALFGHEKGSFTGADQRKIGYIELAHSGTLFLDEVGELPLQIQTKLLRVLQEKTFSRVGGTRKLKSDFRLVAATNRDLANEVRQGRFREDLYYRLNVIPLELAPLKERGKDILQLAEHFVELCKKKHGCNDLVLSLDDKKKILRYLWPGNVRELQNVIERAVILSHGLQLELDMPNPVAAARKDLTRDRPSLDELQRRYISTTLEYAGGRISGPDGAASLLGMKRTSLYSRMRALGMKRQ